MLIGIDASHAVGEERTGVGEACWQIIENLKNVIDPNDRVILYTHQLPKGQLLNLPPNWQWRVLNWPLKKLWSQLVLSRELWRRPPDVFFSPAQLLPFFLPKKLKVITFVHDSAFEVVPQAYNFWGRQYLKLMNRWLAYRSNTIITSTEFNKNELNKFYKVSLNKIKVAPLAYDKERFKISDLRIDILNKYKIVKPYIIFVGRLEEKKNVKRIVEAFNKIKSEITNLKLFLVGRPGVGYGEIKKVIDDSQFKNSIVQPGFVGKEDLPILIGNAEALVFPSLYEGFGLPVLEAFGCGCPVIAADIPALREAGGVAAVYVNPYNVSDLAEAMKKVITDKDGRAARQTAGFTQAKRFSWQYTARTIAEILKR